MDLRATLAAVVSAALSAAASAQPWNSNNILVSRENSTLSEYTRAGSLVRVVNVPNQPAGSAAGSFTAGLNNCFDIDISRDGALVASDWDGSVLVTNTAFSASFIFDASPGSSDGAFVSFATFVPAPGGAVVLAAGGFLLLWKRR